ncbi:cytochrome c peroxidase [Indioceanicola profundi]|uniref:cytochrome c peroxidase n=1 Tax=Indioceanicola profundi TaxID=2220096 RepID=UPI000E6ADD44|nr:cytochrome c peroxidase [Indioceanicola profundi]
MRRATLYAALSLLAGGLLLGGIGGVAGNGGPVERPDPAIWGRPAAIPFPAANPYSPEKAALGERLFFDPRLSGGNQHSCASCHRPDLAWSDGLHAALGEPGIPLTRRTPGIQDMAWGHLFFWDGRADSLDIQALGPISAPLEMNQDLAALPAELALDPDYPDQFRAAFPGAGESAEPITVERIAQALATFQRTIRSAESPFDRWVAGDEDALSPAAKRGFALFKGKAGCANCHMGWAFTDQAFHDIGLPGTDRGRGALLSGLGHAFKTPSLRDVALRAPYMHDGSLPDLASVIDHYAHGIVERPGLSDDLPRLDGFDDAARADLIAFLESLTGDMAGGPVTPLLLAAPTTMTPVIDTAPPPLTVTISQKDRAFQPGTVRIQAGGELVIENDDSRRHNVRISDPDLDVNTGIQRPGETVHIGIPSPGTYTAYCGVHPEMRLTIEAVAQIH